MITMVDWTSPDEIIREGGLFELYSPNFAAADMRFTNFLDVLEDLVFIFTGLYWSVPWTTQPRDTNDVSTAGSSSSPWISNGVSSKDRSVSIGLW